MPHHNQNRGPRPPHRSQTFDSNGPSVKIRGNAYQVFERYIAMAREAQTSGDRVAAENLYQHAEHYFRIMNAQGEGQQHGQPRPTTPADLEMSGGGDQGDGQGDTQRDGQRDGQGDRHGGYRGGPPREEDEGQVQPVQVQVQPTPPPHAPPADEQPPYRDEQPPYRDEQPAHRDEQPAHRDEQPAHREEQPPYRQPYEPPRSY